jgi:tyrosyl-tRNA synthetase
MAADAAAALQEESWRLKLVERIAAYEAAVIEQRNLLAAPDLANLPENPRERQKAMAFEITGQRHGEVAARQAQADAVRLVGGASGSGAADVELPEASLAGVNFPAKAFYLIGAVGIGVTSSEAKRRINDGNVKLDGEKLLDPNQVFASPEELVGKVLRLGNKIFRRLVE